MDNNPRYSEVVWGAQRSGLIYTAISSRLTEGEAAYIVEDSGARAVFASRALREVAAGLAGRVRPATALFMCDGAIEGWEGYEDAIAACSAEELPGMTEGMPMLYSSGTTGRPKGVYHRPPGLPVPSDDKITRLCRSLYGAGPDSVYLSPAPHYHAAPLKFCLAMQRLGATVVVMEHFDPVDFLRLVERHRVTHTQMVPTMFVRLLKLDRAERDGHDLSSLRCVVHAAAPCPADVKRATIDWLGPILHEYYAGTESNGFVACTSEEWMAHPGTVGRPVLGVVHIVGEDGDELGANKPGGIYFEGGTRFEYHNDPAKTAAAHHPLGWSTIGDIGYLDDDGFLYLTDRRADTIVSGGVNIYPREAEDVLAMHPQVLDVAVFGVPNEDYGEEVKAVVQPVDMRRAGPDLERELVEWCRARMAHFKCPRSVDFEAELPRHPTGKLYKRLLKDRYWEGHATRLV
jgi:long-chain acyl-CoA synthetase